MDTVRKTSRENGINIKETELPDRRPVTSQSGIIVTSLALCLVTHVMTGRFHEVVDVRTLTQNVYTQISYDLVITGSSTRSYVVPQTRL